VLYLISPSVVGKIMYDWC